MLPKIKKQNSYIVIMKKTWFLIFSFIFYLSPLFAQSIEWQKSFGGINNEFAYSIDITYDKGYIIAGTSSSNDGNVTVNFGADDYWIVKIDSIGTLEWEKSFGGSSWDKPYSIKQTFDSGYIIAGYSTSHDGQITGWHGNKDYWIIKIDSVGSLQWQKAFGGSYSEEARCIRQTNDKGYVIAGYTSSNDGEITGWHNSNDYWIVKLDSTGSIKWQKALGGNSVDEAYSIELTTDGGYIVVGNSSSNMGDVSENHGGSDYWLVKLDSIGTIQWQKSFGGSYDETANSVIQTSDKGYIIAGKTYSVDGDVSGNHGETDWWIVKIDSLGTLQWQKTLGGSYDDIAYDIKQVIGGGYIIAGYTCSNDGDVSGNQGDIDCWIVRIDSSGALLWQKTLGGFSGEIARSIHCINSENFIIAGDAGSSLGGDVTGNHGAVDFWIVKLSTTLGFEDYPVDNRICLFPNPTSGIVNIRFPQQFGQTQKIEIFDCIGKLQFSQTDKFSDVDIGCLRDGLYFIVFTNTDNERQTIKIIKE